MISTSCYHTEDVPEEESRFGGDIGGFASMKPLVQCLRAIAIARAPPATKVAAWEQKVATAAYLRFREVRNSHSAFNQ